MQYTIREFQTALDVCTQLYGNQDNISTLMLDNQDFDINKVQEGMIVEYTKPENNKTLNEITNNNYIFINRENIVYKLLETVSFDKGFHVLNQYSSYYGRCYIQTEDNTFFLNSDEDILIIYEDNITVSVYIENFNEVD